MIQNATDSSNIIKENLFLAQRNANVYGEVFAEQSKALSFVDNKSNISLEKEGIDQWDIERIVWSDSAYYKMYIYANDDYWCGSRKTLNLKPYEEPITLVVGVDPLEDEPEENVSGEDDKVVEPAENVGGEDDKVVEAVEGGEEIVELEPVNDDGETEEVPVDVVLPDEPEENVGGEEDEPVEPVEGGEETVEVVPVEEEQPVVNEKPKIIGFRSRFGR